MNPFEHKRLEGRARLLSVVEELSQSCPWTKSITCRDMVTWLRSECAEVKEALQDAKTSPAALQHLTAEIGDVLFDALMLHVVFLREFGVPYSLAWDVAARKIEGRTPYMAAWGDGSVAATAAEAELLWQAAKKKERPPSSGYQRLVAAVWSLPRQCSHFLGKKRASIITVTCVAAAAFGLGRMYPSLRGPPSAAATNSAASSAAQVPLP
jgi:NTP pyrophosphatase (non-canonical NTP hydrolase)